MDAYLWSLDHLLQPTSQARASHGRHNLIGTVVTGQQVPQLLICLGNCLVVSLLGFLEHLLGLLNLYLAGNNINAC